MKGTKIYTKGQSLKNDKNIKAQYKNQFENRSSIPIIKMHQNYHKRLGSYLSQPKSGLRKSSSEHSYITAAKAKYLNNSKHINNRYNANFHNNLNHPPYVYCPQCVSEQEQSRFDYGNTKFQQSGKYVDRNYSRQGAEMIASQYYSPEIKTIRNTLLDIRDHMKLTNKSKKVIQMSNYRGQYGNQAQNQEYQRLSRVHEEEMSSRIQQKSRRNRQQAIQIDKLKAAIEQLTIRNKQLQDDKLRSQHKINEYELQVQHQRSRANKAENDRNRAQQRQRDLEIKIMELKADLMRKQQVLREFSFNQEQIKQAELTKRMMLGKSDELSVLVSLGRDKEMYTRGCQTNLTEVDIENGYRQLNMMQDKLCDRINGNLKTEKQIFARIQDIEEGMKNVREIIFRIQDQAYKLGISLNI